MKPLMPSIFSGNRRSFSVAILVTATLSLLHATTTPSGCSDLNQRYLMFSSTPFPCAFDFSGYRATDPRLTRLETDGPASLMGPSGIGYVVTTATGIDAIESKLKPGDQVILKNGEWRDQDIYVGPVRGTNALPIVFRPETPGGVTLTGKSKAYFSGENIIVTDLVFKGGAPTISGFTVFQFGSSSSSCDYCIANRLLIDGVNSETEADQKAKRLFYAGVRGKDITVANSTFQHMKNYGQMLAAHLLPADGSPQRLHVLNNRFFDRPRLDDRGGYEILQIGLGGSGALSSFSIIEKNTFEGAQAVGQAVSINASDVILRDNAFRGNLGTVGAMAGNRVLVESNSFDRADSAAMGGVRLYGSDHWVVGNRMVKLTPSSLGYSVWPVVLGMADKETAGDSGNYPRAKKIVVGRNHFEDSEKGIVIGAFKSNTQALAPDGIVVAENEFLFHSTLFPSEFTNAFVPVLTLEGALSDRHNPILVSDDTAPQVSLSMTRGKLPATEPETVEATAAAQDNVGVARVEFLADGVVFKTDTERPYAAQRVLTWLDNAAATTITAKAYDAAGNSAVSSGIRLETRIPMGEDGPRWGNGRPSLDPRHPTPADMEALKNRYGLADAGDLPGELNFSNYRTVDPRLAALETQGADAFKTPGSVNYAVASAGEIAAIVPKLKPGDQVVLKNGDWKDQKISVGPLKGTAANPIVFRPETPGGVIFSGSSRAYFEGEHLIVTDLKFVGGALPNSGTVMAFGNSVRSCDYCIANRIVFDDYNIATSTTDLKNFRVFYMAVTGKDITVSNSTFRRLKHYGQMLAAQYLPSTGGPQRLHIINNHFIDRPFLDDSNGYEIIQIGNSGLGAESFYTIIENNTIENVARAKDESEIITIKGSDVIVRDNLFRAVGGALVLRSGNRILVESNTFEGGGYDGMGGVRMTSRGHWVVGNTLSNLRRPPASNTYYYWPISLMMANAAELVDGEQDYSQCKNSVIARNIFKDTENGIAVGVYKNNSSTPPRNLPPENIRILDNTFQFNSSSYTPTYVSAFVPITYPNGLPSGVSASANTVSRVGAPQTDSLEDGKTDKGSEGLSVDSARAYPVPFQPGRGSDRITFDRIPGGASIRLLTMDGRPVKTIVANADGVGEWDLTNDDGRPAVSGVYLAIVEMNGEKKRLKVVIQK